MPVIFPGNYVAHLNAYRDQGVTALPGIEFYTVIGVYDVLGPKSGGATYDLTILSPDMRTDDKPRPNKPCIIPKGAKIYRTGVTAVNLTAAGATDTLTVSGVSPAAVTTAVANAYPANGGVTTFDGLDGITALSADTAVQVVASGGWSKTNNDDQTAILVEIDYFLDAPGPDQDMVNLPYKTEIV